MSEPLKLFIYGPARSGTSISQNAARKVLGLPGRGEGHVFTIYQRLIHQYFKYAKGFTEKRGALARELSARAFKTRMIEEIRELYARAYKSDSFVDKTPGAEPMLATPLVLETFPDARFIVIKRTGIEVVQSFQIKFGATFDDACKSWTACMNATTKVMEWVPQALVIDQHELTNSPAEVGKRIGEHVGRPEKAEEIANFFVNNRTEKSSSHDWSKRLTLADTTWSDEEKEHFRVTCGRAMRSFDYSM